MSTQNGLSDEEFMKLSPSDDHQHSLGVSDDDFMKMGAAPDKPQPTFGDSAAGAAGRAAVTNVLPGAAAAAAFAPVATALAPTAAITGGVPVIPIIGGGIGSALAYMGARKLQDTAVDKLAPDSSFGSKQSEADMSQHPVASTIGGLIGGGRPSPSGFVDAYHTLATPQGWKSLAAVAQAMGKTGG